MLSSTSWIISFGTNYDFHHLFGFKVEGLLILNCFNLSS